MAYRTSSDKVQKRLGSDFTPGRDLLSFAIPAANALVTRLNASATADGYTLSSTELSLIETELACHFYCVSDRVYTSKSTLGASGSFAGQYGKKLEATPYGQSASSLDPSGWLQALMNNAVLDCQWMGKPYDEQLSYDERNGVV